MANSFSLLKMEDLDLVSLVYGLHWCMQFDLDWDLDLRRLNVYMDSELAK